MEKYFPAAEDKIPEMLKCIEEWAGKTLTREKMATVRLVAEEALFNIVTYGYPLKPEGEKYVALACAAEKDVFMLQLTDGGVPFDPLADGDYSLTRAPGGFGRIFIRHYTDSAAYERRDGKNIMRLVFKNRRDS